MMEIKKESDGGAVLEPDFYLQWGHRKRLRCVKSGDGGGDAEAGSGVENPSGGRRRRVNRRLLQKEYGGADSFSSSPLNPLPCPLRCEQKRSPRSSAASTPEKEEVGRCYTTRGWAAAVAAVMREDEGGVMDESRERGGCAASTAVMPRFFISLSNKEKEEDFLAMKGCKLPQRPKKRAKLIQKALLLVSPGAWLSDLTHERYEVREKKGSRKRKRGLKAMCMDSDSE